VAPSSSSVYTKQVNEHDEFDEIDFVGAHHHNPILKHAKEENVSIFLNSNFEENLL
jgi:hypothetical protein